MKSPYSDVARALVGVGLKVTEEVDKRKFKKMVPSDRKLKKMVRRDIEEQMKEPQKTYLY